MCIRDRIVTVPIDDGVKFQLKSISEIMDEAEYPGIRVSMSTTFDGVVTPLKDVYKRQVPNHLTEQWASEFLRLYPSANILVTTKKEMCIRDRIPAGKSAEKCGDGRGGRLRHDRRYHQQWRKRAYGRCV